MKSSRGSLYSTGVAIITGRCAQAPSYTRSALTQTACSRLGTGTRRRPVGLTVPTVRRAGCGASAGMLCTARSRCLSRAIAALVGSSTVVTAQCGSCLGPYHPPVPRVSGTHAHPGACPAGLENGVADQTLVVTTLEGRERRYPL